MNRELTLAKTATVTHRVTGKDQSVRTTPCEGFVQSIVETEYLRYVGRAIVGACVWLVACADPGGVFIHISHESGQTVELFVGNDRANDPASCNADGTCQIVPPGLDVPVAGIGWTMTARDATRAELRGGDAWLRIEPDANIAQTIPALLAVVFKDGAPMAYGLVHGLTVGPSEAYKVEIALDPVTADAQVLTWRRPTDLVAARAACAVVTRADGSRELFVPDDDPDCDDALLATSAATECTPASSWAWCDRQPSKVADASCVASGSGSACRIGAKPCVDAGVGCPMRPSCTETPEIICVPSEVCSSVASRLVPCDSHRRCLRRYGHRCRRVAVGVLPSLFRSRHEGSVCTTDPRRNRVRSRSRRPRMCGRAARNDHDAVPARTFDHGRPANVDDTRADGDGTLLANTTGWRRGTDRHVRKDRARRHQWSGSRATSPDASRGPDCTTGLHDRGSDLCLRRRPGVRVSLRVSRTTVAIERTE